jgi:hypothetical protein
MTIFVSLHTAPPRTNKSVSPDPLLISSFVSSSFIYKQKCVTPKEYYSAGMDVDEGSAVGSRLVGGFE